MANPVPTFSTVVAADRKLSSRAVLGVLEGGNRLGYPRAVLSVQKTRLAQGEPFADKYFRFAVDTMETVESDWADPRQSPYIEKTAVAHRELPQTTTSSSLPSRWKALGAGGTHPKNAWMKFG